MYAFNEGDTLTQFYFIKNLQALQEVQFILRVAIFTSAFSTAGALALSEKTILTGVDLIRKQ